MYGTLKTEQYKSMIKNVGVWPKALAWLIFIFVYQLPEHFDLDTLGGKLGGMKVDDSCKFSDKCWFYQERSANAGSRPIFVEKKI